MVKATVCNPFLIYHASNPPMQSMTIVYQLEPLLHDYAEDPYTRVGLLFPIIETRPRIM